MLLSTLGVSAIALFGSAPTTPAYPIEYHSLRMLCEKSDLVVQAEVNRIQADSKFLTWFDEPRTVAVLDVLETFCGEKTSQVRVEFMPNMVCPQPAHYPRGEKVLAFLRYDEERSIYFTVGLSYGTKKLDDEAAAVYGKHIRTFFELHQRASNHEEMSEVEYGAAMIDWQIDLCADSATRHDGAYDLVRPKPEWKQPGKRNGFVPPPLTGDQLRRIHSLFYEDLSLDESAVYLLAEILLTSGDPEVRPRLTHYLRTRVGQPMPVPHADEYMRILAGTLSGEARQAALNMVARFEEVLFSRDPPDEDARSRSLRLAESCSPILREFLELVAADER